MKAISKEDLLLLIPLMSNRNTFNLNDFEEILERFGDDYFVVDGRWEKTNENETMKQIREY